MQSSHAVRPAAARGFTVTYRPGQSNCCPACSGMQWHVGRQSAECAYCDAALPLADPALRHQPIAPPTSIEALRLAWRALAPDLR